MGMGTPFLQGLGVGAGLIAAIGAQNAFVLAQGIRKNHHLVIALICIGCDVVLISAGVGGFGVTGVAACAKPENEQTGDGRCDCLPVHGFLLSLVDLH